MSIDNAKIKVRNRNVEIKWVTLYCDHILDNHINKNKDHDIAFAGIANLLEPARYSNLGEGVPGMPIVPLMA